MSEENNEMNGYAVYDVREEDIRDIAKSSYLEYGMSVIVDRALPDSRDGLKPVHRRILFSMNEMKVAYNTPYKKSARIVGDVIGKYHPHGDSSVYNAKVRMAQPFSMRLPLIDGQGNFGSVDGDSPAAMRYTEARMTIFSSKYMLNNLNSKIVKFRDNYDGTEREPTSLPLNFPNLIINGGTGIAVGLASYIPPHNPIEAMNCVKYKVQNRIEGKTDSIDDLVSIMPAPDFPTGGIVHGAINMREAFISGRAKMYLQCKWEEIEKGNCTEIHITEIPYMVKREELFEKIEELIKIDPETKLAKVDGVRKAEDYSDKVKGTQFILTLHPDYDSELVMKDLFSQSELQKTCSYNATVIVDKNIKHKDLYTDEETELLQPETLGLNELFDHFIDHRLSIIYKKTWIEEQGLKARSHILEGLRKAIDPSNIDNVIKTIRSNKNTEDAIIAIMELLDLDHEQSESILQMRLSRLTGMEVENIDDELNNINQRLLICENILTNDNARLEIILEESDEMINQFSKVTSDGTPDFCFKKRPFKERISEYQLDFIKYDLESLTKEEECNIILTAKGFMRRVPISELSSMNRGSRGKKHIKLGKEDFVQLSINSHSHDYLIFVTNTGQSYVKRAFEISDAEKGRHINWILELADKENEKVVDVIPVKSFDDEDNHLAMFTAKGLIKLSKLDLYSSASRKGGIRAIKLREDDKIISAKVCTLDDEIFMVNSLNKIIRFPVNMVTVVGRSSQGVRGMRLAEDAVVVGAGCITNENGFLVCVSENGLIKVSQINSYRTQSRGGSGSGVMKESERSGKLFNSFYVEDLEDDVVFTTKKGFSNRKQLLEFNVTGRNTSGVTLTRLEEDDSLVDIFPAPHVDVEDDIEDYIDNDNDIDENDTIVDSDIETSDEEE